LPTILQLKPMRFPLYQCPIAPLDATYTLVQRYLGASSYLTGIFAPENEKAVLQAYTAYVQAQKGFLSAAVRKRNAVPVHLFRAIAQALEILAGIVYQYGSRLEANEALEVGAQAATSFSDLREAISSYRKITVRGG
jgi:hypothetical protein